MTLGDFGKRTRSARNELGRPPDLSPARSPAAKSDCGAVAPVKSQIASSRSQIICDLAPDADPGRIPAREID